MRTGLNFAYVLLVACAGNSDKRRRPFERRAAEPRRPLARRLSVVVVPIVALCFLTGCFTFIPQILGVERGSRVFSGTRGHIMAMEGGTGHWNSTMTYWIPGGLPPFIWWHPLDLPLSLAADIALLPWTIPAQLIWGNFEADKPKLRFLLAGASGNIALAREIIEERPKLAQEAFSSLASPLSERSLLSIAAATGRLKFVKLLVEHGADARADENPLLGTVHPASTLQFLPLYSGERRALLKHAVYVDVVGLLMRHGADPAGPLASAAGTGRIDLVRAMLKHGADVNPPDTSWTPLHAAAWDGKLEMARFLIEHGANVNAHSRTGETPLGTALQFKRLGGDYLLVAELLRRHGGTK